ncbi:serine/threonine-protein kinase STY46-like [Tripterygium wilfordii]|uniref:serine/threonine-protein kinase STY46-like n=1 Tax=Tripterygium wilfordii TaxID=458696 RepID=UPI0018F83E92|nr:serine/threonine-protein kinase STY46-like [Tripterygium wilfordii]
MPPVNHHICVVLIMKSAPSCPMLLWTNQHKKITLFCYRQSATGSSTFKQGNHIKASSSGGCCRGIKNCLVMGSIASKTQQQPNPDHHRQPSSAHLEQQVVELEREAQKQIELRIMYRKKMERTQEYLRYILQIAQDNGFLNLILNRDPPQQYFLSPDMVNGNTSPNMATPPHIPTQVNQKYPNLISLIDQAKINGWYIEPLEIELQEKIGQGSTAEIYRAIWRGLDVAVKCLNTDFFTSTENGVSFFAQELETLSKQRHRFVLQLMGACLDPPNYGWIVTELLGMTLKDWLHGPGKRQKERVVPLPPLKERIAKALEIAQAMQYLHEQKPKVVHRDLKPSNIFLDDSLHVRVADFGHARFLTDDEKALTGETGTYVYMAPEVICCEPYGEKCDVYSFSIILNELITGEYPYIETDFGPAKIAMEVGEGKLRPALPKDHEGNLGELIDLISISWDQDASIRPSFATVTCSLRKIQQRLKQTAGSLHDTPFFNRGNLSGVNFGSRALYLSKISSWVVLLNVTSKIQMKTVKFIEALAIFLLSECALMVYRGQWWDFQRCCCDSTNWI